MARRFDASRAVVHALTPDDRLYRRSFEDEVAIDFPSARAAAECVRRDGGDADVAPEVSAEIVLDRAQAELGTVVSLAVGVRQTCVACGGRGEAWGEPCPACLGNGDAVSPLWVEVRVPPGSADGDSVRFAVTPRRGPRTRVDVRLTIA